MIPFNKHSFIGTELSYIEQAIKSGEICGDGEFTKKCSLWFEENFKSQKVFMTTSCTHAIEMAVHLAGIQEGDEIIMPSYTFVSTANPFVLRGAKIVFVDIRPDTMNIDENLIEQAVTKCTKAIVPVHYAGVGCEMDKINDIAKRHNLFIIEDAAQGVMAEYKGQALGTIGDFGTYSFHETKNYTMGEGGAILIKDGKFNETSEIIREKGTNRSKFFRGQVDKYTWLDVGSSYLPSELNAAFLFAQLESADKINNDRLKSWCIYYKLLKPLETEGLISLPFVPKHCKHNAHMFYIKTKDLNERTELISYLKNKGICTVFHYVPLHSSPAGLKFGRFFGDDIYTTAESEKLIRLPLYFGMGEDNIKKVCEAIISYTQFTCTYIQNRIN